MAACNQDQLLREQLQEKLMQFIAKKVLTSNVYKIVLSMCRYETIDQEKSLREQLKRLDKFNISTQDLDISAYFLLNENGPIRDVCEYIRNSPRKLGFENQTDIIDEDFDDF